MRHCSMRHHTFIQTAPYICIQGARCVFCVALLGHHSQQQTAQQNATARTSLPADAPKHTYYWSHTQIYNLYKLPLRDNTNTKHASILQPNLTHLHMPYTDSCRCFATQPPPQELSRHCCTRTLCGARAATLQNNSPGVVCLQQHCTSSQQQRQQRASRHTAST
jgi:hypothetical protein